MVSIKQINKKYVSRVQKSKSRNKENALKKVPLDNIEELALPRDKKKQLASFLKVILIRIIGSCSDVRVCAAYGTLLGAIRHGDIMPHDDNIDLWLDELSYTNFVNHVRRWSKEGKTTTGNDNEDEIEFIVPRLSNGQKRMKFICAFDECHSRDLTGKRIREKRITLYNKVNKLTHWPLAELYCGPYFTEAHSIERKSLILKGLNNDQKIDINVPVDNAQKLDRLYGANWRTEIVIGLPHLKSHIERTLNSVNCRYDLNSGELKQD